MILRSTATDNAALHPLSLHDALPILAGAIRSALTIQMAGLVTQGRADAIPALVNVNPFQFVTDRGKKYAGEYFEVDRKSTRLNSSHGYISYAVFCLKKKNNI